MKKQNTNFSFYDKDCVTLVECDGNIFVTLFTSSLTLCIWCDEKDTYDVWAVLDCSSNISLLCDYIRGEVSLLTLYETFPKTKAYAYSGAIFNLFTQQHGDGKKELVAPYEDSFIEYDGDAEALIAEIERLHRSDTFSASRWRNVFEKARVLQKSKGIRKQPVTFPRGFAGLATIYSDYKKPEPLRLAM